MKLLLPPTIQTSAVGCHDNGMGGLSSILFSILVVSPRDLDYTKGNNNNNNNCAWAYEGYPGWHFPHFLASAAGSIPFQCIILSNVALQPDSPIASYLSRCSAMFECPPPDQPLSGKQSFWDRPEILADEAMVESSL